VTIGGAIGLDPEPGAGGVRRARTADRLVALTAMEAKAWAGVWLAAAGLAGLSAQDLVRRGGQSPADAERILDALIMGGTAIRTATGVMDAAAAAAARATVVELLTAFHREHPDEAGVPREVVRDRIGAGEAFETILEGPGTAVTGTERLALASHRPVLSRDDARIREALDAALKAAGLQPPDVATLAAGVESSAEAVQKALQGLAASRRVQRLEGLWFHADTLAALKSDVRTLGAGASIDVAAAKTRFGVSRKFAIPLLEYLDRERVTRRMGDRRVVI
jgi:selenocysteine-specific elongation factor